MTYRSTLPGREGKTEHLSEEEEGLFAAQNYASLFIFLVPGFDCRCHMVKTEGTLTLKQITTAFNFWI